MIEVNTLDLINAIDKLTNLINNYEEIQLNLFNQLEEICNDWQEPNSNQFTEQVYEDRKETDLLIQNLKEYKDVYSYIYNQYSNIGKTIMCNSEHKTKVSDAIQACEEQASQIINSLNTIDNSFEYKEYNDIQNQKQKIIEIKNNLAQIKTTINETFNKITTIENHIKIKISKLEEIHIN